MELADRVAVVTGAAKGIGLTIAQRLGAEGAVVVIGDVDGEALAAGAESIGGARAADVMTVKGDLSTRQGAADLIGATVERHGRVDVLVNNAGGGVIRDTLAHTEDTLRETIDRNLWTTIYCTLEALPVMVERRYGRIVNIGAESVRNGLFQHAIYNAAKGGVHGLTTGLAREFISHGITVNTVAPSMIATEQVAQIIADPQLAPLLSKITDTIPAGRPGEMSEVASMVAYLASDEATFVTGQVISVNGGSSML